MFHESGDLSDAELDALFAESEPEPEPPVVVGDLNLDGSVDFSGISPFIALLSGG